MSPLATPPRMITKKFPSVYFLIYDGRGVGKQSFLMWASLMAQMVKNLPAMQEKWVQSLSQEDRLEKRMATHSSTLAWQIPFLPK